ncbi:hypothetical protein CP556_14715 [Natrinema sp. CBA1119]|nr:hypothetical protein CP556_14715 [Natrinema sp. CBA1119]
MTDDAVDIRYRPTGGPSRKVSFRPRSDGGWLWVTLEWNGCQSFRCREFASTRPACRVGERRM